MAQRHRRRFLRNLFLVLIFSLILWYAEGCPLPTQEMELHRWERQRLAPESTVVWSYQGRQGSDRDLMVGVSPDYVHAYAENYRLVLWPRSKDAATLVVLPDRTRYTVQGGSYLGPALLAVDPPSQAESAQLVMTVSYRDSRGSSMLENETYQMEGEKQGSCFFFQLQLKRDGNNSEEGALWFFVDAFSPDDLSLYPYTLTFYDSDGDLLETVSTLSSFGQSYRTHAPASSGGNG